MSVVPLTLTISLCLVFTFVLFFLREFTRRRFSGAESESLLPLADEMPRLAGATARGSRATAVFDAATLATDTRNATSGGCGNHSLDTAKANGSEVLVVHNPSACTRNCAACRLRALHRAVTPSAATVSTT